MGQCKKYITPLLMLWSYVFIALTHRYWSLARVTTALEMRWLNDPGVSLCMWKPLCNSHQWHRMPHIIQGITFASDFVTFWHFYGECHIHFTQMKHFVTCRDRFKSVLICLMHQIEMRCQFWTPVESISLTTPAGPECFWQFKQWLT